MSSRKKKNKLSVECSEFEFLMEKNDYVYCSASFSGVRVSAPVRLDNLQLSGFGIHVRKACWEISPKLRPVLLFFFQTMWFLLAMV
jgi:hypothetical protein